LRVKPPTFHQRGLAPRLTQQPPAQRSFLARILIAVPRWAWENKFKTAFVIVFAVIAHKVWTLYKTYVRPFLDIAKSLKGDSKAPNPESAAENQQDQADAVSSGSEYYQEVFEEEEIEVPQIEEISEDRPSKPLPKRRKKVPNKKSLKFINRIASSSGDEKMRINVFQSTLGMTRQGLKL